MAKRFGNRDTNDPYAGLGEKVKEGLYGLRAGWIILTSLLWALFGETAHSGEVITEIRFRDNSCAACPAEKCFSLVDIHGGAHTIPVQKGERFVLSRSRDYRGAKQYSTDYTGFVYKKVKMGAEFYHWFYLPESSPGSSLLRQIDTLRQHAQ